MIRTSEGFAQFFYRVNEDKSRDAICATCFSESGQVVKEEDLRTWETAHRCSGWMKKSA
jgi:hypothetical protein